MPSFKFDTLITELKGVGKAKAAALNKLGIFNLGDLVYFFPRAYEKRGDIRLLGESEYGKETAFLLTVASDVKNTAIRRGMTISSFRAFDESGSVEVVFFNSPFVKNIFTKGAKFRFYGKLDYSKKHIRLSTPKYEPYIESKPLADFYPIYPLTEGLSSKFFGTIIKSFLSLEAFLSIIPLFISSPTVTQKASKSSAFFQESLEDSLEYILAASNKLFSLI